MATEVITLFGIGAGKNSVSGTPYISSWTQTNGGTSNTSGFTVPSNILDSCTVNIVVKATTDIGTNDGYLFYSGSGTASSDFYLCDSTGNTAVKIETITSTKSISGSQLPRNSPKTVNLRPLAGQRVYIKVVCAASSPTLKIRGDCKVKITYDTWSNCTAPTAVNVSRSRSVCTVSWSGMSSGTNNAISNYRVLVNTSASESGATTVTTGTTATSLTSQPNGTAPTTSKTYYFGVRSQAKYNNSAYKWSGAITVPAKPSVSAGTVITKAQMDTLKTWINGSQTTVTQYAVATAAHGNTYRSGLTAGTTAFDDAWYNAAANG